MSENERRVSERVVRALVQIVHSARDALGECKAQGDTDAGRHCSPVEGPSEQAGLRPAGEAILAYRPTTGNVRANVELLCRLVRERTTSKVWLYTACGRDEVTLKVAAIVERQFPGVPPVYALLDRVWLGFGSRDLEWLARIGVEVANTNKVYLGDQPVRLRCDDAPGDVVEEWLNQRAHPGGAASWARFCEVKNFSR